MADVRVRLPLGALADPRRPRRARRTPHAPVVYRPARHSVTVEGRVQLSSGALDVIAGHGTPIGRATKLKPWRCVGSTPTRATGDSRRKALGRRAVCKAAALELGRFDSCPTHSNAERGSRNAERVPFRGGRGPLVYRQDTAFSARQAGFDSSTDYWWRKNSPPGRAHGPDAW